MVGSSKITNGTPAPPPSLKKSTSSSKNQTSIAGFFRKKDSGPATIGTPKINGSALPVHASPKKHGLKKLSSAPSQSLTPAPSSDAAEEVIEEEDKKLAKLNGNGINNGLPSPITPAGTVAVIDGAADDIAPKGFYSPSRKVCFYIRKFQDPC